tara:strand:+ start:1848 stop:2390 length:543 start_codon:yes stop_codon:yes gene_type:complete
MRDLREVGQKVIDSIMKTKPTDAGDLAIGIEDIISDLRSNPAQFQEKLDHLEGLFNELAYGEEYALRDKVEDQEDEDDVLGNLFGGFNGAMSGTLPLPIAVSGAVNVQTFSLPVSNQITAGFAPPQPACPLPADDPCDEVPLGDSAENIREQLDPCSIPAPEPEELIKPFKPAWWKTKKE